MSEETVHFVVGTLLALTVVEIFLSWRWVRVAREASHLHRGQARLWRSAAINTAAEWVRREKGDAAADDFRAWASVRSDALLRDYLPAIAHKHAARWPSFPPRGAA